MVGTWLVNRPEWLNRVALVLVCGVLPIIELFVHASTGSTGSDALVLLLLVTGAVALLLRNRFPIPVMLVCGASAILITLLGDRSPLIATSLAVALYSLGASELPHRVVVPVTAAACAVLVVGLLLDSDRGLSAHDLAHVAAVLTPVIFGRLAALRRVTTALRIERADLALRAERDLQQLRIEQERRRIARDLHDAVGHALTTITVQAGVAARLLDTRPEFAREALLEISAAGAEAMRDLRGVVGVLRRSDAESDGGPAAGSDTGSDGFVEREPCLDDLPTLLDRSRGIGVNAGLSVSGSAEIPRSVQVAVYRVVQESLTNIGRHAGVVRAEVEIAAAEGEVAVRIWNAPGDQPGPKVGGGDPGAVGAGLVGMRERVSLLGGHLDADRTAEGGFEVRARIPLPAASSSATSSSAASSPAASSPLTSEALSAT